MSDLYMATRTVQELYEVDGAVRFIRWLNKRSNYGDLEEQCLHEQKTGFIISKPREELYRELCDALQCVSIFPVDLDTARKRYAITRQIVATTYNVSYPELPTDDLPYYWLGTLLLARDYMSADKYGSELLAFAHYAMFNAGLAPIHILAKPTKEEIRRLLNVNEVGPSLFQSKFSVGLFRSYDFLTMGSATPEIIESFSRLSIEDLINAVVSLDVACKLLTSTTRNLPMEIATWKSMTTTQIYDRLSYLFSKSHNEAVRNNAMSELESVIKSI